MPSSVQLFAPEVFPTAHSELRAYTIAAFRIAQQSDQLSLIPMSSLVLEFLLKERALGYWVKQGRLIQENLQYRLTPQGLVLCQSALAGELATHNTAAAQVEYWVSEFNSNQQLPRSKLFQI